MGTGAGDRYGTPTLTETSRETVPARMEQMSSTEDLDREVVVGVWRCIYNDPGYQLNSYDRVEYGGTVFDLTGIPSRMDTPRGVHHYEAQLQEVIH